MFSIKQTGVPAGAALAGALLPVAALALGWRTALVLVASLGLGVIAAAAIDAQALDTDHDAGQGVFAARRSSAR